MAAVTEAPPRLCSEVAMEPELDSNHNLELALDDLATTVRYNLENEKDWTGVTLVRCQDRQRRGHGRPLLHGLPPRRLYVHPDEQIEILKAEKERGGERIPQPPEREWVLPIHLAERWTVGRFAAVMDSIEAVPPDGGEADGGLDSLGNDKDGDDLWKQWRGPKRGKRLVLAIVQDDSTVSYYVMHDGIVKPRQN